MQDVKGISQRYILFSAIGIVLIIANLIVGSIEAWLVIDLFLIILLTNRVTENHRVYVELKKYLVWAKDPETELKHNIQKISRMFSILFGACLILVVSNMIIGHVGFWYFIDAILLIAFTISIIIRILVVHNT